MMLILIILLLTQRSQFDHSLPVVHRGQYMHINSVGPYLLGHARFIVLGAEDAAFRRDTGGGAQLECL